MSYSDGARMAAGSPVPLSATEWLKEQVAAADASTADQIVSAEGVAAGASPGLAPRLGGADPAWSFASEGDAQEAQSLVGAACRNCVLQKRCPEDACRYYRIEQAALNFTPDAAL